MEPQRAGQRGLAQIVEAASAPVVYEKANKSRLSLYLQFLFILIIPTIVAVVYFGFIASDRYVSNNRIVIQSADMGAVSGVASLITGSSLGGGGGMGSQGDILASYIHSNSILQELDNLLDLRKIYSPESVDQFSRLGDEASQEDFLEYYRKMTLVEWDPGTSLLYVEVEAFTPNDAKLILDTIIMLSEEKLNSLKERKQSDRVAFARQELKLAEERLFQARLAVADFRRKYGEIDPLKSAEAKGSLLATLNEELAAARTELTSLRFALKPESPQVQSAVARIKALEEQVSQEKAKATRQLKGDNSTALSDLVTEFEGLIIEEEFARATYTSALAFLENTRASAQQDSSYVVDFIEANLPQEATQPKRLQIIASVFVICLLVLGIGNLIVAAIKEQARL